MYEARRSQSRAGARGRGGFLRGRAFPRPNGLAFTEVTHVPHRDASGRVLGVYVVVTDVTQRKLSERAIAESEARFRTIANSAPVPMWVTGPGRPARIRQPGLYRFLRRLLRRRARVRLARGPASRRSAAHPPRGAAHRDLVEADHGRGPLPARRRAVAVAAGGVRSRAGAIPASMSASSASRTTSPTRRRPQEELTRINETLERRVEERTAELAASEALVQTFFRHSPECHAVLVEDEGSFRFQEVNPATLRLYGMTESTRSSDARPEEVLGTGNGRRGQPPSRAPRCAATAPIATSARTTARPSRRSRRRSRAATGRRGASSSAPATSANAGVSRSSCARRRRWRRSASSPAASRMTSTTC